ncbi:MAG: SH3 domain-containing protein [Actinomycetota bacterium]
MRRLGITLLALAAAAALVAGCGDDGDDSVAASTTTTTDDETTTTAPADDELPGEDVDFFFEDGDELAVVGVEAGDTLNVRAGPGVDFDVVAELAPLATDVAPTGRHRSLDGAGIWTEVRTDDGGTGWVNAAFLAYLGLTDDVTTEIAADPADLPSAATMLELGDAVAATRIAADGSDGPVPDVVVVDGPSVGDLGEITIDIVGLPDDSGLGERLHLFATPSEDGKSFTVRTVERTILCRRGAADGFCL